MAPILILLLLLSSATLTNMQEFNGTGGSNLPLLLENIFNNINLNSIIELVKNETFSLNDFFNSQIVQDILVENKNNSSNITIASVPLEALLGIFNQIEYLQHIFQQMLIEDSECLRQLQLYYDHLWKGNSWATEMFDATAKPQSGVFAGNIMHVGHYDECLKIKAFVNGTEVNGQYCSAIINDKEDSMVVLNNRDTVSDLKLSYGFCLPAACSAATLNEIVSAIENKLDSPFHFHFIEDMCDSFIKRKPLSNGAIFSIVFFAIMGVIIISSTMYDLLIFQRKKGSTPDIFMAFSFYTNGRKLFSTKTSSDSIHCLNGLRVISMMWIMLAHRYMYTSFLPLTNLLEVFEFADTLQITLITAANMAVDTFFVVSGLLIVYLYLMQKEKGRNIPLGMFYLHRFLRLTPSLAVVALVYGTLLEYMGSGPFWKMTYYYLQEYCETNWWSTLLYVQNYVNAGSTCVGQSWYLAVDTQLYFLSPLLFLPMIKWPKRTIGVIICLAVACAAYSYEVTWRKQMGAATFGMNLEMTETLYVVTHVRAAPWLAGIVTGYVIFTRRKNNLKITKIVVLLMWILSLGLLVGIILYHNRFPYIGEPNIFEAAIFNAMGRVLWALGISVIIFACATGYGGLINKFLSCTIFNVLIRLNYSIYLLHILVIVWFVAQKRTPEHASNPNVVHEFVGDFGFTLVLSVIWTLSFESPILILEKILFGKKTKPAKADTYRDNLNNNNISIIIPEQITNNIKP